MSKHKWALDIVIREYEFRPYLNAWVEIKGRGRIFHADPDKRER